MEHWDIEISERMYDVICSIFQTIGLSAPRSVSADEMEKVLTQMKFIINSGRETKKESQITVVNSKLRPVKETRKALVVSKLGIIRYQLKLILSNRNIEVATLEFMYAGLAEYVKRLHDLVVIDVAENFDDTLDVIKEIHRISVNQTIHTTVIALINPVTTSETKNQLLMTGVDRLIEKRDNWYEDVLKEVYSSNGNANAG